MDAQFAERFDQESFKDLQKLENMLLTGQVDDVVDQYPELKRGTLAVELPFFKSKYEFSCSKEAAEVLRELPVEVWGLFEQVEALVRLLLVVPASSSEAERGFSALRWLKTWLRARNNRTVLPCVMYTETRLMSWIDQISVSSLLLVVKLANTPLVHLPSFDSL